MDNVYNFTPSSNRWYSLEDFDGEIWKDIPGYEGLYKISNYGRVKSLKRYRPNGSKSQLVPEKIKKGTDNRCGYLVVTLSKSSKTKKNYIHRLVGIAFLPNPFNLPEINHKDEDKSNNKIDNLEWCSSLYNTNYGTGIIRGRKKREENGFMRKIDMYDLKGNLLKQYLCGKDIEKDGISRRAAYLACENKARSYKGCVFRFHGQPFYYREIDGYPKGKKKNVIKTDVDGKILHVYRSIKEAERENGLNRNCLYSATYASTRKAYINGCYFEIKTE